ncbi:DUF2971 domain-containing protein [Oligoflexus tunisiensis]|uniref:DUF2971 domain-containing protein n=1 Tax=Oligoflexus tunisiensis TaxID=708132 RepID=UPI000ACFD1A9|nr:DUF2971 domain-containing protein [Oligoflexus tunisiensis]
MSEFIYRLRPTKSLFDREELEKQQIYFASLEQLNDPMEGYRDIFWEGDKILWNALLRNYVHCVYQVYILIRLGKEDLQDDDIFVFNNESRFPTQAYKERVSKLFEMFFENDTISQVIARLSERGPIGRDELNFYLKMIHPYCLSIINESESGISTTKTEKSGFRDPVKNPWDVLDTKLFDTLKSAERDSPEIANFAAGAFEISQRVHAQMELITILNTPGLRESLAKRFYFVEFPQRYIRQLERLMYPNWYTACFFSDPTNPATWGYYTNDHSGVCLKFRTDEHQGQRGIHLHTVTGTSARKIAEGIKSNKTYGKHFFRLYQVEYGVTYPKIDFFKSIGRLPIPQLLKHWFADADGTISKKVRGIMDSQDEWREAYWSTFIKNTSIKLSEWKHENESRLILSGVLDNEIEKADRLLKYDFNSLEGIIFGIKTSIEDKLKIIDIIDKKCSSEGRKDFKFYQASYSSRDGKMHVSEMRLLKFT